MNQGARFLSTQLPLVSHLLLQFLFLSDNFDVSIFPVRLSQLDGTATDVLAVQLLHGASEVCWIREADEPKAFCLVGPSVSDDLGPLERRESAEGSREDFVGNIVTQVAAKNPEIVVVPFLQGLVLPNLQIFHRFQLKQSQDSSFF